MVKSSSIEKFLTKNGYPINHNLTKTDMVKLDSLIHDVLKSHSKGDPNIKKCYSYVKKFFRDEPEKVSMWFLSSNPMFGGLSPMQMIAIGKAKKILQFIEDSQKGYLEYE